MINLLPPQIKDSYQYARYNTGLRRWVIALVIALAGLGLLGTYGLLKIHQSAANYTKQIAVTHNELQQEHLPQVKTQVKNITGSLRLVVQVLSKEVLFSKLISQIGAAMPSGTILTGLTINQASGGLNLTAAATNYTAATQIQVNLSSPRNGIFAKTDILSINCSNQNGADVTHPCSAQFRALFNTTNQFLFINQGSKL